ncbi:hypothetical protein [Paludibaculum fermentans]|uniref:hypothetical protein n=1 Tax=Paludibaculum fermentans TaxID=1473598 RepID=UPI003EBA3FA5
MALSCSNFIVVLLCAALLSPAPLAARQQPGQPAKPEAGVQTQAAAPVPGQQVAPGGLRILVLEGQNVHNSLTSKSAISPVVQVLDAVDQPVQGATVTFEVPPAGPGGTFDGKPSAVTKTDSAGQATAPLTINNTAGAFAIRVTASFAGQTGETRIRQANDANVQEAMVPAPPKPWFKNWKWWAVIGAGAGAGVATAMILSGRNDKTTITIGTGSIGIGGPQ